jgi:AcrR family transcriptional regulator
MEIILSNTTKQDTCISSKVFEKARHLFNTIGIRNTTMDDLAKELGISKKTLYKEVENKADLVKFCVQYDLSQDEQLINNISENTENAIEELVLVAAHISKELQIYHPAIIKDITKLYPECWSLIENHKDTFVKKNISDNIKKGIKQGLYRKDVDAEIATMIQLHLCFLPLENIYNNHNPMQVYQNILRYNLYAIATPKGIELFEQLIKKIKI